MDKYYTPTIDELYAGFECEQALYLKGQRELDWDLSKDEDYAPYEETTYNGEEGHKSFFRRGRVRVKYLDQSDIESLGFDIEHTNMPEYMKYDVESSKNWIIRKLIFASKENMFSIALGPFKKFEGIIKNKSELKRVLKMIGYGE